MNTQILRAGSTGAAVLFALLVLGGGLDAIGVGRVVVMAGLVYLAARGRRWAAWLLSFWLLTFGAVVFAGVLNGTDIVGMAVLALMSAALVGSGVLVLKAQRQLDARSSAIPHDA